MSIESILSRDAHERIATADYWSDDDWDTNISGANAAYQGDAGAMSELTGGADVQVADLLDLNPDRVEPAYVHVIGEKHWINGRYPVRMRFDVPEPETLPDSISYTVRLGGEKDEIQELDVTDRAYAAPRHHEMSVRRGISLTAGEFGAFVGRVAPEAGRTTYKGANGAKSIYASEPGDL